MRTIISFGSLFLSVILLQLSTGGVGPLDALSGLAQGFSARDVGLLGSAHFMGFFIGCWWAPRVLGTVGHSRAFAAFTATGVIGLLAHVLVVDPWAWAVMRVATGICVAGNYTVIESWLNSRLTNDNRGRAMGIYRVADMGGSLVAQLMIGVLEPASYISYTLLAIIGSAALFPLALTKATQPDVPEAPRLRPLRAVRTSPLAACGVVVAAVSSASFRMVGPIYGQEVGLDVDQIAFFLAAFVLGGALAQYPVGWLADRFDRRMVLILLSVAAIASSLGIAMTRDLGQGGVFLTAVIFGLTTVPVYSISAAHAHDFIGSDERVELSAALMFFYAVGAIAAPLLASALIEAYGPAAMFLMNAVAHGGLVLYGVYRLGVRPTRSRRTPYFYTPRTTFVIGRLTSRFRDRAGGD